MSERTFHFTTFTFHVVSDEPISDAGIEGLAYIVTDGCGVLHSEEVDTHTLTGREAAALLDEAGSDSEFFLLNSDGEDLL